MKDLSRHIRLDLIHPDELEKVVEKSGLVTESQLLKAYRAQARIVHGSGLFLGSSRSPTWLETKSDVVTASELMEPGAIILVYPWITSGVTEWCVKIEESASHASLGIFHTGFLLNKSKSAGDQRGG